MITEKMSSDEMKSRHAAAVGRSNQDVPSGSIACSQCGNHYALGEPHPCKLPVTKTTDENDWRRIFRGSGCE